MGFGDLPDDPEPIGKVLEGDDIMGDCSIMKTIIKEAPAENTDMPDWGNKVTVHYVGTLTLDGTKFDSSRDRNQPFEFTVGSGVIQGWSEAVPTMRVGEIAKFTICSDKAYGPSGNPPKIPAGASLDFEIELLSFIDREDICHDGKVLKKLIKPSPIDAWDKPNWRCDIELLVKQDGEDVACSWPSVPYDDVPAPPPLGLPDKLRDGVHEMKKGERASFLLPEHAPGKDFEVEVVSWIENEECVRDDPGGAVKRVERPHEPAQDDWKTPNDEDGVAIRGRVWAAGAPDGACVDYGAVDGDAEATWKVDEDTEASTKDGPRKLCDGVEHVVKHMKKGEVCTAKIRADLSFKDGPLAGKALEARLQLVRIDEQTPSWELKGQAKIDAVNEKRTLGNLQVANLNFARAIRRYTTACDLGASDYDCEDDAQKEALQSAVMACTLNRAMCSLRQKDYAACEKDCSDVLAKEPDNLKALFRRAKAKLAMEKWDDAKKDFKKMLALDEGNPEARRGVADIVRREKAQKEKDKKLYAGKNLFGKHDARSSAPKQPKPEAPETSGLDEPPPSPGAVPPDPEPVVESI